MSIDLMRDKPTVGVPIGHGTNGTGAQLQPVNPAYNTYVGARYVPIFAGEWDATKTYEPLTIVMWQGNSYTSKTFVPAQTEISNEDFWALTGNYNAQVEVYRKEVEVIKENLKTEITHFDDIYSKIIDSKSICINSPAGATCRAFNNLTPNGSLASGAYLNALNEVENKSEVGLIVAIIDFNDKETSMQTINNFVDAAKNLFPNASVKWVSVMNPNCFSLYPNQPDTGIITERYITAIGDGLIKAGKLSAGLIAILKRGITSWVYNGEFLLNADIKIRINFNETFSSAGPVYLATKYVGQNCFCRWTSYNQTTSRAYDLTVPQMNEKSSTVIGSVANMATEAWENYNTNLFVGSVLTAITSLGGNNIPMPQNIDMYTPATISSGTKGLIGVPTNRSVAEQTV